MAPEFDWIREPDYIMLGLAPWPPPRRADGRCPVCGQHVMRRSTYCAWCDMASEEIETQVRAANVEGKARDRAAAAENRAREDLERHNKVVLSERDRRRIWNGYIGMITREAVGEEVTNRAKVGREWLLAIGQAPDFSVELKVRPDG